jgi:hypothetical protein
MTRRAAWAARAVGLGVAVGALAGCGASPAAVGPSGVDGLTIPTPSPRPADFTDRVDNPWFPLVPGSTWTYRRYGVTETATVVATVLRGTVDIAGIPTTAVRWEERRGHDGRTELVAVRWYAQDTAGNVWWFGQRVYRRLPIDEVARRSWRAGRHGAEAGLVVSATPRDGDGYFNGYQAGVVERRSTVLSVNASVALPHGHFTGTVETQDVSKLEPSFVVRSFYARGVGLVAQVATQAVDTDLTLERFHRP